MSGLGGSLAVDLGLSTGWAYGCLGDAAPLSGTWLLPKADDLGKRYVALDNALEDAFALYRPARVVVASRFTLIQTSAQFLLGLLAHTHSACYRAGIQPPIVVAESSARKSVLGRGRFPDSKSAKSAALEYCRLMGWDVRTDHAADAAILWVFDQSTQRLQRKVAA